MVASIFRHGARGPLYENFDYNSKFNNFYWAQLTPTGQRQHYVLGQTLRERYIENSDIGLDRSYNHSQIYVRSTDVNRTINSAISQLIGFYPPGTGPWLETDLEQYLLLPPNKDVKNQNVGQSAFPYNFQNIPVHNYLKPEDYLLSPLNQVTCPNAVNIQQEFRDTEDYQAMLGQINLKYKSLFEYFNTNFKQQLVDQDDMTFENSEGVWDTLIADQFNGQRFDGYDDIPDDIWTQLQQVDSLWWSLYQAGNPKFYQIGASRVLQTWIQYSEVQLGLYTDAKEFEHLKYVMYSCHDDNVVNMQLALGLMDYTCLWNKYNTDNDNDNDNDNDGDEDEDNDNDGNEDNDNDSEENYCFDRAYYASQVIYELYQIEDNAFVKIMFDGQYVNKVFNLVGNNFEFQYDDFKQAVAEYIFDGDYSGFFDGKLLAEEYCKIDNDNDGDNDEDNDEDSEKHNIEDADHDKDVNAQSELNEISINTSIKNNIEYQQQDDQENGTLTSTIIWIFVVLTLGCGLMVMINKYTKLKQSMKTEKKGFQQLDYEDITNNNSI